MKNITLAIDEEVLRAARRYAASHDTTVNALVRDYLTRLIAFEDKAARAREELVAMAKKSKARMGSWKWNREDAYEGRRFSRHEHSDLRGLGEPDGAEKEGKGD